MSVGAAASPARAVATPTPHIDVPVDDGATGQSLPPVIRDGQGREYRLQQDPVTGAAQYRHADEQRDQAGSSLTLEILITLAPDGAFTRRTTQQLQLASGDSQREMVLGAFDADGVQLSEQVESVSRTGSKTSNERTTGTYAAGELVRRETHLDQSDEATDSTTAERTVVSAKIHGVWENGGAPVTDATVPRVDRSETQQIISPGEGINKDTDRTITFTRHGAGPLNALDWDADGSLVVRFAGHGSQYIERELRVPLDQTTGEPDMANAETVRTDDKQNLVNKGLMQARIWGGLASNLSWIIGLNFARGNVGKGFLALSAAASGAQLVGETHAVATRRNDGDWTRVAMSAYDVLLTGMLAAYVSGRRGVSPQLTGGQLVGANALGAAGLAANGAELSGALNPIGTDALGASLRDVHLGASLSTDSRAPRSPLDADWRLEPRFDAARALLA